MHVFLKANLNHICDFKYDWFQYVIWTCWYSIFLGILSYRVGCRTPLITAGQAQPYSRNMRSMCQYAGVFLLSDKRQLLGFGLSMGAPSEHPRKGIDTPMAPSKGLPRSTIAASRTFSTMYKRRWIVSSVSTLMASNHLSTLTNCCTIARCQ